MNTGLSDIFNGNSVDKLLKNDFSPQTTNLARINTGIAEMQFGSAETPKGIETLLYIPTSALGLKRLEVQKPQRGLKRLHSHHRCHWLTFGRTETPKGI